MTPTLKKIERQKQVCEILLVQNFSEILRTQIAIDLFGLDFNAKKLNRFPLDFFHKNQQRLLKRAIKGEEKELRFGPNLNYSKYSLQVHSL